jgi:receptor protein-tyrosine kinase
MGSIERAMRRKRAGSAESADKAPTQPREKQTGPAGSPARAVLRHAHPLDQVTRAPDVVLDHVRLQAEGLLTPEDENTDLREQYRLVKRKLITQCFVREQPGPNPSNLIQVTSSVGGEGKTFSTFNLGMSIAMERDVTVLLVDADLTRRSLTQLVGLTDRPGLTDVLTGGVEDLGEIVCRTDIPRLSIIPAGKSHPHATELIASEVMRDCTRELAGRYKDRMIIFDSTPLLMDSQAATLAEHMGQVLVVVEAGRTSARMVNESVVLLGNSQASQSLLLNKSVRGHGYGYYGGY